MANPYPVPPTWCRVCGHDITPELKRVTRRRVAKLQSAQETAVACAMELARLALLFSQQPHAPTESVDAVDPSVADPGTPSTRDK